MKEIHELLTVPHPVLYWCTAVSPHWADPSTPFCLFMGNLCKNTYSSVEHSRKITFPKQQKLFLLSFSWIWTRTNCHILPLDKCYFGSNVVAYDWFLNWWLVMWFWHSYPGCLARLLVLILKVKGKKYIHWASL